MNKLYIHALCEIKFDENVYVFNDFPNYIIIGKDEYLNDILSKNAYKIKDYYYDKDSNNPLSKPILILANSAFSSSPAKSVVNIYIIITIVVV